MDYLKYTYDLGNQLTGVKDYYGNNAISNSMGGFKDGGNPNFDDYKYDANGNMVWDANKNINGLNGADGILYNHLNLPTKVIFNPHIYDNKNIEYVYDATGVKQKKVVNNGAQSTTTTSYAGNYIYENNTLKMFSHPEGYTEPNNQGGFDYVYQYKDHLGNIRLSYSDMNKDGVVAPASWTTVFFDDFEDSVQGVDWNGSGNSWGWDVDAFDTSVKKYGNTSARLDTHSHWENVAHSNEWVEIDNAVATDYIYSAWVYLENVNGNQADIFLFMKKAGETGYTTLFDSQTTYTKGKWIYLEKRFTVPAHVKKLNIRLDNDHAGKVWFDDVSIRVANSENEIVEEYNYYPGGALHKGYNIVVNGVENKYKTYQGKEYEESLSLNLYDFGARLYDPFLWRTPTLDPLSEERNWVSPYSFQQNNPINRIDPTGALDIGIEPPGDYYDKQGNWLYNDGIDDNKVYEVSTIPAVSSELKGSEQQKIEYVGQVENVKMTFTGEANSKNTKQADGNLNVIQEVSNGKEYTRASFDAVGGPWGNGSPENGNYLVNTLLDRGPKGWYNKGMTKEGVGFSLNIDPQFKTGRSLLRIHPDGGKYFGTQGCIGLTCGKSGLTSFRSLIQSTLSNQKNISLNINILNNLNNNGYGKKVKSNGE